MTQTSLQRWLRGVFSVDISWLTQTCDAVLPSCEVLFCGEKSDFLAICTSQPQLLKQKGASQVARSASQLLGPTSQVGRPANQSASRSAKLIDPAIVGEKTVHFFFNVGKLRVDIAGKSVCL